MRTGVYTSAKMQGKNNNNRGERKSQGKMCTWRGKGQGGKPGRILDKTMNNDNMQSTEV